MTSLFHYDPWGLDEVDHYLDNAFGPRWAVIPTGSQSRQRGHQSERSFKPKADIHEGPNNTVVATIEIPGLKREDINIELHDTKLTISGERHTHTETRPPATTSGQEKAGEGDEKKEPNWIVRERSWGKFSRSITVPEGTKPDSIKATVTDGVLTVTFPKQQPRTEPQKITIS